MLKNLHLLIPTILLFGVSAFFRKMAVDRIHPFQMQIVAGAIYALEVPIFLYLINKNGIVGYNSTGVMYAVLSLLTYVFAAVMFGTLLKGSSDPGMLSSLVAMNPVVTTALTVAFLGEQLTVRKAVATAVMLLGFFLFNGLLLKFEKANQGQTTFPPVMMASVLIDGQVKVFDIWEGEMHLLIPHGNDFP